MPTCQNCNHKWNWSSAVLIGFKNNKSCPNCGERQYVMPKTQLRISLFTFLPLFLLVCLNSFFDLNNLLFVSFATVFILGMFVFIPFTIKLSNEQKPLW